MKALKTISLLLALLLTLSCSFLAAAAEPGSAETSSAARFSERETTGWAVPLGSDRAGSREASSARGTGVDYSEDAVRNRMLALKSQYPNGMHFTNDDVYSTNGMLNGICGYTGYGCVAFAFLLRDAAFGDLPFYELREIRYDELRAGDILRINGDRHSVMIIRKNANSVEIAEANYNSAVKWGRTLTKAEVLKADYVWTSYPDYLPKHAAPIPHKELLQGVSASSYRQSDRFYGFTALDTGWSAVVQSADLLNCTIHDELGYFIGSFDVHSGEELFVPQWPEGCQSGAIYYLRFECFVSKEADFQLYLSNIDPELLPTLFADVGPNDYFVNSVSWALAEGITSGVSPYRFGPKESCTRAQVVTFLWNAAGKPEPEGTDCPFVDVNASAYYRKAVLWAVEQGITSGKTADTFAPKDDCTRAEVVTFLWNAAGRPEPETTDCPFEDVNPTSYYYRAVLWAVENQITSGTDVHSFSPKATCTRAQVVTFLYKASQLS